MTRLEKKSLDAVHSSDLELYLERLGVLEDINAGNRRCKFCGDAITVESLYAIYPESGSLSFICAEATCVAQMASYISDKEYASESNA